MSILTFLFQSSEFLRSMFSSTSHRNSHSQLHHLTVPEHSPPILLSSSTNNQILSPCSSTSSGPSSPSSAPYTPVSATLLTENYIPSDLDAQAQAEIDLQMEMQMQQEFAAFSWANNNTSSSNNNSNHLWGSDSVLLRDDFDLNSIPPIELGVPKYTENLTLAVPNASGLEFAHEFSQQQQQQQHYLDDCQLLGFDEMMAGHGF